MGRTIIKVENKKQLKHFIDFPHDLYADDPNYVAELYIAIHELLTPKKNPYFKHSTVDLFMVQENGKYLGRIAVTVNNNYNKFHNSNVAFFGFFDTINDQEVAKMLLDKAEEICKEKNIGRLLGPTNLTTNDTAAMLVEGFDSPPVVQMTYNKPYYKTLVENLGYTKDMDMYAYKIPTATVNTKSLRLAKRIEERLGKKGITFRKINLKNFKQEASNIREIYKSAWEKNWGFVPPTDEEFDHLAEGLKMIVLPNFTSIAEIDGKMIGFAVALPDINEILISNRRGRLFPTAIFKLLLGKKKTKAVRVVLLGVVPGYRKMGIEGVFFAQLIQEALDQNKTFGEASWILENNTMMVKAAENLNGEKYKTYRIYGKAIS